MADNTVMSHRDAIRQKTDEAAAVANDTLNTEKISDIVVQRVGDELQVIPLVDLDVASTDTRVNSGGRAEG